MKRPLWQSGVFFALGLAAIFAAWFGVQRLAQDAKARTEAATPAENRAGPAVGFAMAEASPETRVVRLLGEARPWLDRKSVV